MNNHKIKIAIADDHKLFVKSIGTLLETLNNYEVIIEADNGKVLLEKIEGITHKPDIVLLDVNMPVLNGIATAKSLYENYALIKTVALSMNTDDYSIIEMLKAGCCAYLLKDCTTKELDTCLQQVYTKGFYNSENHHIIRMAFNQNINQINALSELELTFLKLACSDKTYKVIAAEMGITERMVDLHREKVFQKLNVQSRTGMVLEAIKRKLILLEDI